MKTRKEPLTSEQKELAESLIREFGGNIIALGHAAAPAMVRTLLRHGHTTDDIEQICRVGVCHAARRFDASRGASFTTCAWNGIRGLLSNVISRGCAKSRTGHTVSGDAVITGDATLWVLSGVAYRNDKGHDPVARDAQSYSRAKIRDALRFLDKRSKEIITMRWGLDDGVDRTLEEVGEVLGITRERVRQIEAKAITRMRERLYHCQTELLEAMS